jgi:hypothetical protein
LIYSNERGRRLVALPRVSFKNYRTLRNRLIAAGKKPLKTSKSRNGCRKSSALMKVHATETVVRPEEGNPLKKVELVLV